MQELKYDKLIETVKTIGGKYFGLDFEVSDESLIKRLLDDTECGGIFGNSDYERQVFFKSFYKVRTNLPPIILKLYLWRKSESGFFKKIFTDRDVLIQEGYSCAKYRLLLPFAYLGKCFHQVKKPTQKKVSEGNKSRMELMRELGMIEQE